jgi:hypothetical protein
MTVAMLAGIAGAISYSHMRELAAAHGEAGWHAQTLPLSVDAIEIVASLVLLAERVPGALGLAAPGGTARRHHREPGRERRRGGAQT